MYCLRVELSNFFLNKLSNIFVFSSVFSVRFLFSLHCVASSFSFPVYKPRKLGRIYDITTQLAQYGDRKSGDNNDDDDDGDDEDHNANIESIYYFRVCYRSAR